MGKSKSVGSGSGSEEMQWEFFICRFIVTVRPDDVAVSTSEKFEPLGLSRTLIQLTFSPIWGSQRFETPCGRWEPRGDKRITEKDITLHHADSPATGGGISKQPG